MARIWQIRQSDEPSRYGMDYRKKYETEEEMDAYECGYEEGYGDAMKEVNGGAVGQRMGYRGYMDERGRGESGYRMDDGMGYRRHRDSRGRYM